MGLRALRCARVAGPIVASAVRCEALTLNLWRTTVRGLPSGAASSGFPRQRTSHTRGRAGPRRGYRPSRAASSRRRPHTRRVGISAGGRVPNPGVARVPFRVGDSGSASRHGPESRPASWTRRTRQARSHTSTTPSDAVRTPRPASRRRVRTSRTTPCASAATPTTFGSTIARTVSSGRPPPR